MRSYLQYHNAEKLGWVPLGDEPFLERELAIRTRRKLVESAVGGTVYLIARIGRPTAYYLWERFTVEHVEKRGDEYHAWGAGRQLVPPQLLSGPEFEAFRKACAYFVGFMPIDRQPYLATLRGLADRWCRDGLDADAAVFCTRLIQALPESGDAYFYRGMVHLRLGQPGLAALDLDEALRRGTEHAEAARAARAEVVGQ
jgi:hypothetical protein